MKRQETGWEKIFAKHISGTYKELLQLNDKKARFQFQKGGGCQSFDWTSHRKKTCR